MDQFISVVEFDFVNDEYLITFPPEILEKLGWKEHDEIQFIVNDNMSCTIIKVEKLQDEY
jgi:bifunctional DNA-binding transcriptional regulator/antitoxin component of YhaV-PrlF toxin-antitoxin module